MNKKPQPPQTPIYKYGPRPPRWTPPKGTIYGFIKVIGLPGNSNGYRYTLQCVCGERIIAHDFELNAWFRRKRCFSEVHWPHEKRRLDVDPDERQRFIAQAVPWDSVNRLKGARRRCEDPASPDYPNYGARGITFNFSSVFDAVAWIAENLGPCPPGRSLDRINNDGPYGPGNLRWATAKEQASNRRKKR